VKAVKASTVLTPHEVLSDACIFFDEETGLIESVSEERGGAEVIEYKGCTAAPGFIDLHIHGCVGFDFTADASVKAVRAVAEALPRFGATSAAPTLLTSPLELLRRGIESVVAAGDERIIGIHLEGPYINPERGGAHARGFTRRPSLEEFAELHERSRGLLNRVTVAPELEGALEFIKGARKMGVVVSLGHTDASYETAVEAFDAGATMLTHAFNAMRGFHHRDPGILGAALERDDVVVEAIPDLLHLHPSTLRLLHRCKGPKGVALVSDAMEAAGLRDGVYRLGGVEVRVEGGASRTADGALAGSTAMLDRGVGNLLRVGIPLRDAVIMSTDTPARSLNLRDRGRIAPGYRADIVILGGDLRVRATYVAGRLAYSA